MKKRIEFLKQKLTDQSIEYFKNLKEEQHCLLAEACEKMKTKFPELEIGKSDLSLFLEGLAILIAITDLSIEKERNTTGSDNRLYIKRST